MNNSDLMIETWKSLPLFWILYPSYSVTFQCWVCLLKLTGNMGFLFTVTGLLYSESEALLVSLLCTRFCC